MRIDTRGIRSTRIVTPRGVVPGVVVIQGEKIAEVAPFGAAPAPGVLDVGDLVVSPGLVDCHVHMNEPGRTEWEGFETATRAAAAGGVTTVVDMPLNSLPVTTTRRAFEAKLEASEGKRYVDVGYWGGVIPGNASDLPELSRAGVLGCKAFLVHSGIDEFPNATEKDLLEAMPRLRDSGLPLLAHAELDLGADVTERSKRAYRGYLQSRPPEWENAAIALLIDLCRRTRCPVHIVHLSSAESIPQLRAAKESGLPVTVETCPHYLCLEAEAIPDGATEFKCAPPIRDHENREGLWRGLFEGVIDFVITDHSPCTPHLKLPEVGDFHAAWGGIASLSLGLANLWTEGFRRGATLEQLARWTSDGPARFAGLSGKKGRVEVGLDADLVVWDPAAEFVVDPARLYFKHKVSPYLGASLHGRVLRTFLRGREVFDGSDHPSGPIGKSLLHREAP